MMAQRKTKNLRVVKRRSAFVPEKVYKVVAKPKVAPHKHKKKVVKKPHQSLSERIHTPVTTPVFIVFLIGIIVFSLTVLVFGVNQINRNIQQTNESITLAAYDKDTLKRLQLIGQKEDYPSEIAQYQSAPADLQAFLLNDYKMLKTSCIVNGSFAGPLSYTVVNVVYDSFARIEKNCNGTDTLLLKKMSGTWTVIYSGNDLPKCSEVNAFGIPQGISYKCRDGFVTYTNPNP